MTGGMNADPSAMPAITSELANARSDAAIQPPTPIGPRKRGAVRVVTVTRPAATNVRWRIVALLAGFSLLSYALRTNISIAAALMRTELNLSDIQLGYIFTAFLVGYAVFQAPA